MESLKDKDILIIFDESYTEWDIQRFMETFQPIGYPVVDDGSFRSYFEKMAACRQEETWRFNYFINTDEKGKILHLERF